jgi:hypothetical protein
MDEAEKNAITENGKYRRKRRADLKRLGFVEMTVFVPRSEVKALKKDLANKLEVAKRQKELKAFAKKHGIQLVAVEQDPENKASTDVLAGQQRPAKAAPKVSPAPAPPQQAVNPVTPPQSHHEPSIKVTMPAPYEPVPDTMRSMLTDPAPQPSPSQHQHGISDRDMDAMLANANGMKAFP